MVNCHRTSRLKYKEYFVGSLKKLYHASNPLFTAVGKHPNKLSQIFFKTVGSMKTRQQLNCLESRALEYASSALSGLDLVRFRFFSFCLPKKSKSPLTAVEGNNFSYQLLYYLIHFIYSCDNLAVRASSGRRVRSRCWSTGPPVKKPPSIYWWSTL